MLVGPVIHRAKFKSDIPITMRPVETKFRGVYRGPFDWPFLMRQIARDPRRNAMIARIAVDEMHEGNSVLVLSRQIGHLQNIRDEVDKINGLKGVVLLTGKVAQRDRNQVIKAFRAGQVKVLLATQLADEGLDVPRLNRVLLTWPGKHDGRLIQQIGRAIRKHPDKTEAIIYDFVDEMPHKLGEQFRERLRTYSELGIVRGKVVRYANPKKKRNPLKDWKVRRA